MKHLFPIPFLLAASFAQPPAEPVSISGVYPHLAMRNSSGECGTGAVVPWQGSLWAITYAPHAPTGSDDKLYEVTPALEQLVFKDSVGGTPANRMIHRESDQLLIGPYVVDAEKRIRVIPQTRMFGRLTGTARHLADPANKVYYATMEEGLYEVDVRSLDVVCHIRDNHGNAPEEGVVSALPGYHGKGLYMGQGRLVYANNGEKGGAAHRDPTTTSGALAQWFGEGDWRMVRRNQFTEVTGPGGILGGDTPATDPVWAMGWDARSLILALLEEGTWSYYRLPKGSHSYDGAHGWNTEWPRIREIGGEDLLATMHGTFWRFPAGFSRGRSAGIAPRSNYLKVIGDFCRWNGRVVLGCDDSAKSEFLNTRAFKAKHGAPKESNSNLWFVEPERLDALGPPIGRGSVWLRDDVEAGAASDPYLFSGYDHRQLHLHHVSDGEAVFDLEVDRAGNGIWTPLRTIVVPAGGAVSHLFAAEDAGAWIRLLSRNAATGVTANFQYRDRDGRDAVNDPVFAGVATVERSAASVGLMRSLACDKLGVVAATNAAGGGAGYYEMNQRMELVRVEQPGAAARLVGDVRQPLAGVTVDAASVVVTEDGKRYRLPKDERFVPSPATADEPALDLESMLATNLARGAKVRASSVHGDYAPGKAVDGRLGDEQRWIGHNAGPTWLELDFGEARTFRSVWVVSGWKGEIGLCGAGLRYPGAEGRGLEDAGGWRGPRQRPGAAADRPARAGHRARTARGVGGRRVRADLRGRLVRGDSARARGGGAGRLRTRPACAAKSRPRGTC